MRMIGQNTLTVILLSSSTIANAERAPIASAQHSSAAYAIPAEAPHAKFKWSYRFENFPAMRYKGKLVGPKFDRQSGDSRDYPTAIGNAARAGAHFAGYMSVAHWGCGTSCSMGAITDLRNGRTRPLPLGGEATPALILKYNKDSNLMLVRWQFNTAEPIEACGQAYYLWTGQRLKLLRQGVAKGVCQR
jgi:hypothetical protein